MPCNQSHRSRLGLIRLAPKIGRVFLADVYGSSATTGQTLEDHGDVKLKTPKLASDSEIHYPDKEPSVENRRERINILLSEGHELPLEVLGTVCGGNSVGQTIQVPQAPRVDLTPPAKF